MSAAACLKLILNEETKSALVVFGKFVEMEIVDDEDFREVTKAEERLVASVTRINKRIAERQG